MYQNVKILTDLDDFIFSKFSFFTALKIMFKSHRNFFPEDESFKILKQKIIIVKDILTCWAPGFVQVLRAASFILNSFICEGKYAGESILSKTSLVLTNTRKGFLAVITIFGHNPAIFSQGKTALNSIISLKESLNDFNILPGLHIQLQILILLQILTHQ